MLPSMKIPVILSNLFRLASATVITNATQAAYQSHLGTAILLHHNTTPGTTTTGRPHLTCRSSARFASDPAEHLTILTRCSLAKRKEDAEL
jgi:hypothetical protein